MYLLVSKEQVQKLRKVDKFVIHIEVAKLRCDVYAVKENSFSINSLYDVFIY